MTDRRRDDGEVLARWRAALQGELGADDDVDIDAVLGLAGSIAHGVVRPAAPLTTYLVGVAVGRALAAGRGAEEAFADAAGRARALAATGDFAPPPAS